LHRGLDRLDTLASLRDGLIERGLEPLIGFECASNWKPSLTAGSVARAAFPTIGGIPAACFQVSVVLLHSCFSVGH
jgi:hypothetical protein